MASKTNNPLGSRGSRGLQENPNPFKASNWYGFLAEHTFPASFVKLSPAEAEALANGKMEGDAPKRAMDRLRGPMDSFPGNSFVFVDTAAPTDTERFEGKRGAVYSPRSAWRYLCESEKVRSAVESGDSDHICVRPFRRMSQPREFRLFIRDGELLAMSQYWLVRHFRRLEGRRERYWSMAREFVEGVSWQLPVPTLVMDIYFTARNEVLIVDLNPWGPPTDPLLIRDWERDWNASTGIHLIPPPVKIGGDVNVSF